MDNRNKRYKKNTSFDMEGQRKGSNGVNYPKRNNAAKPRGGKRYLERSDYGRNSAVGDAFQKDKSFTKDIGKRDKFNFRKNESGKERFGKDKFIRDGFKKDRSRFTRPASISDRFDSYDDGAVAVWEEREVKKRKPKLNIDTYKEYVNYIADNGEYKTVVADREETDSLLKFIGLCKRAGGLVQGAGIVDDNLSVHKISLLIIAGDAGKNARKLFKHKIEHESLATVYFSNKKELASILGRDEVVYIGITDKNFAGGLWEKVVRLLK